ncbi:MAG: long-chain fatty acid--CoA ligase [Methylotenera sp.]|nr:long-chain fatty acid--CoA ligase [Oligoflexia bacterium]
MPFILRPTLTQTYLTRIRSTPRATGFQFKPRNEVIGPVGVWKQLTFKEFDEECREVSHGLMALGVEPGDKVAILSNTRYEWPLSDMAILGAQAVTVPLYASSIREDVIYILNHCEAKVAFLENAQQLDKILDRQSELPHLKSIVMFDSEAMNFATARSDILTLTTLRDSGRKEQHADPDRFEKQLLAAQPSDPITICYTSGTTGIPKGVVLTHENMMSVLDDCVKSFGGHIRPEKETLLAFLPFSHIIGKVESVATYVFGWKECYAETVDKMTDNMLEVKPTILFAVPRIFEKAYAKIESRARSAPVAQRELFKWAVKVGHDYYSAQWSGRKPSLLVAAQYAAAKKAVLGKVLEGFGGKLRFALCGGAPLPREIGEYFQTVGITILEGYGLTETCAPVALNTIEHLRFGTVGRPLPEVSMKIAEDGEILIKSKKIFKDYHKEPEESAAAFTEGWFHSGDIGFLDSSGYLHITDRKKDIIVTSGGKNVAPQKIENLAKAYPLITQMVVHGDRRNYLSALLTLDREQVLRYANENQILFSEYSELVRNPKIRALVQRLVDDLNSHLASYETIKKFGILPHELTIESGELTPSMKVKRSVINKKYLTEFDRLYTA